MNSLDWTALVQRCRFCDYPVPPPEGLLRRELFHVPRCPACHGSYPHPAEYRELRHTLRTLTVAVGVLALALIAIALVPKDHDLLVLLHDATLGSPRLS